MILIRSLIIDAETRLRPFLEVLAARPAEARLWPFTRKELEDKFREACVRLALQNLRPCLYSLRRGGASEDLLTRSRADQGVKRRGRWASDSSPKRYAR